MGCLPQPSAQGAPQPGRAWVYRRVTVTCPGHHWYWTGQSNITMALAAMFSAMEVVPLTLLTLDAWDFIKLTRSKCDTCGHDLAAAHKWTFDSIPQDELIACVRMRVVDGSVLGLIRQWLKAPVVEPPQDGKPPTARRNDRGTPQGGVLSPKGPIHWKSLV